MRYLFLLIVFVACASPTDTQLATGTEPESPAYAQVIHALAESDNEPQAGEHMPWCPKGDCMLCLCLCAFGPKDPPKNNVPPPVDYSDWWSSPCAWCPPVFGGND